MKEQLNLNTLILSALTALFIFGLNKGDQIKTQVEESSRRIAVITVNQEGLSAQMAELRGQMKEMVLKNEFRTEVSRLNREIEALKKTKP